MATWEQARADMGWVQERYGEDPPGAFGIWCEGDEGWRVRCYLWAGNAGLAGVLDGVGPSGARIEYVRGSVEGPGAHVERRR